MFLLFLNFSLFRFFFFVHTFLEQAYYFYQDKIVDAPGSNLQSLHLKQFAQQV